MQQFLEVSDLQWPWSLTFSNENWHFTYSCPRKGLYQFVFKLRARTGYGRWTERQTDVLAKHVMWPSGRPHYNGLNSDFKSAICLTRDCQWSQFINTMAPHPWKSQWSTIWNHLAARPFLALGTLRRRRKHYLAAGWSYVIHS